MFTELHVPGGVFKAITLISEQKYFDLETAPNRETLPLILRGFVSREIIPCKQPKVNSLLKRPSRYQGHAS